MRYFSVCISYTQNTSMLIVKGEIDFGFINTVISFNYWFCDLLCHHLLLPADYRENINGARIYRRIS